MIKKFEQFNLNDPYGEEIWDKTSLEDYLEIIRKNIDNNARISETRIGLHFVEFEIKDNLPGTRKKIMTFHIHNIGEGLFGLLLINDNSEVNLIESDNYEKIYDDLDEKIDKLIHQYFYDPLNPFKLKKLLELNTSEDPYNEEIWDEEINERKNEIIKYFIALFGDNLNLTKVARWEDIKWYCEQNGYEYNFVILTIKDYLNNIR